MRIFRLRSIASFVVVVIAGCATAIPVTESRAPAERLPQPTEGVLVVSITSNTGEVSQIDVLEIQQQAVPGTAATPGNVYTLNQVTRGISRDTSLFVGNVPAGTYTIRKIADTDTQKYIDFGSGGAVLPGPIAVQAERTADLGRLLVTPVGSQVVIGRSQSITSNRDLTKELSPENAFVFDRPVDSGWVNPHSRTDGAEKAALDLPVGTRSLTEIGDGRVAATSRLGTIWIREANGTWKALHTGRLETLNWITYVGGNEIKLIAVGELNAIYAVGNDYKLARISSGNLPPGNLFFIYGSDETGWWVGHEQGTVTTVFFSWSLAAPNWQAVRRESTTPSEWSGANPVWMFPTPVGFGYATGPGDIWLYDVNSKTWTQRKAPDGDRLISVNISPKGIIGALTSPGGGFGGIFAGTYYSRDLGQTWTETDSPLKVKISPPIISSAGTIMEVGGVFGKPSIQASKDEGKTWTQLAEIPAVSIALWSMESTGLFRISSGQSGVETIQHSGDDGVTWRLEYSSYVSP